MAYGPITSWQIDGETVETVADFIQKAGWLTEKMANYHLVGVWMLGSFMDHRWGLVGKESYDQPR